MITLAESGLTSDEYAALQAEMGDAAWKIYAHAYSLSFAPEYTSPYVVDNIGQNFDAVMFEGLIYRTNAPNILDWYDPETETGGSITIDGIADVNTNAGLGLAVSDGLLHIFFSPTSRNFLYHWQSATPQVEASWVAEDNFTSVNDITRFAASSATRVHFVTVDAARNLFQLKCADLDGGIWTTTSSDIFWTYPIVSFDVETYGDADSIIVVSQVPGDISVRADNGHVTKIMEPAGGIIAFKYRDGYWSDHVELDVITNISAARYRATAKVSVLGDLLFVTGFAVDGTKDHTFGFYRYYKSSNGKHFSLGQALPFIGNSGTKGVKLLKEGDLIFAVEKQKIYTSFSTLETGHTPTSRIVELTSYVQQYQITHEGALAANLSLSNANGDLTDHPIINADMRLLLLHYAGYWIPDDEGVFQEVLIHVATTEVDTLGWTNKKASYELKIQARDAQAWMSDRSQSDQSYYWENQTVAGDNYRDNTDTTYGGLRHTATQGGAWSTPGGTLQLAGSNKEGSAFNTVDPYIWNGGAQIQFKLSGLGTNEYAGLLFRAMDKDNLWFVNYARSTDRIYIGLRQGGLNSVVGTSVSTMGWTVPANRWLRIDARYGKMIASYSLDGVTWTEVIIAYATGAKETPQPGEIATIKLEKGYFGIAALGWGVEEAWSVPDYTTGNIIYEPPNYEDPDWNWDFPPITTSVLTFEDIALVFNAEGKLARSRSFKQANPFFQDILLPTDCFCKAMDWDWHSAFATTGQGELGCYFIMETAPVPYILNPIYDQVDVHIYRVRNMLLDVPAFELQASGSRIVTPDMGSTVVVNRDIPGMVAGNWSHGDMVNYVVYTVDDGDTWDTLPTNPDGDVLVGTPQPTWEHSRAGFDFVGPLMVSWYRNTAGNGHLLSKATTPYTAFEDYVGGLGGIIPISGQHSYLVKAAGLSGAAYVRAHQHTELDEFFVPYWHGDLWRLEPIAGYAVMTKISPLIEEVEQGDAQEISVCPSNPAFLAVVVKLHNEVDTRLVYSSTRGNSWIVTPVVDPTTVFVSSTRKVYYGTATDLFVLGGASKKGNLATAWGGTIDTVKGILTLR